MHWVFRTRSQERYVSLVLQKYKDDSFVANTYSGPDVGGKAVAHPCLL